MFSEDNYSCQPLPTASLSLYFHLSLLLSLSLSLSISPSPSPYLREPPIIHSAHHSSSASAAIRHLSAASRGQRRCGVEKDKRVSFGSGFAGSHSEIKRDTRGPKRDPPPEEAQNRPKTKSQGNPPNGPKPIQNLTQILHRSIF